MLSIWPEDIKQSVPESALSILKKYGDELKTITNFAADGIVNSQYNEYKDLFEVDFSISSRRFENYSVKIFSVSYNETLWPVKIQLEKEVKDEISTVAGINITKPANSESIIICKDKDEFMEKLRIIFNAKRVRFIVHAIMAQSK